MKFMAIDINETLGDITISKNSWTQFDPDILLKTDAQRLAILLSKNQVVVADSRGAPCPDAARRLIFKLLFK